MNSIQEEEQAVATRANHHSHHRGRFGSSANFAKAAVRKDKVARQIDVRPTESLKGKSSGSVISSAPLLPTPVPPRTPAPSALQGPDTQQQAMDNMESAIKSAMRASRSPTKSPSKPQYLTKESNLTGFAFTAWDVEDRLHEVEAQFRKMKEAMDSSMSDHKSRDDALELAKTRGTCRSCDEEPDGG